VIFLSRTSYQSPENCPHGTFVSWVEVPVEAGRIVVDAPVSHQSQPDGLEDSHLDLLIAFVVDLVPTEVNDVGAIFEESAFDESMLR
jgi:hypothetical protein